MRGAQPIDGMLLTHQLEVKMCLLECNQVQTRQQNRLS